jgi:hypothetical protein
MSDEQKGAFAMIFCGILIGFIASAFIFYERPKEEIEEPATTVIDYGEYQPICLEKD